MSKLKASNILFDFNRERELTAAPPSAEEFAQLYSLHQALVRSVIYQITGLEALDDLVQETFIRIWKGMASFRHEAKITSWIYRVSVNQALDHIRSANRRQEFADADAQEKSALDAGPEKLVTNRDLVTKALLKLSEDHRTVIVLALLHELPLAEVADVLGVSEGTVKSRLHYAKADLRKFLGEYGVKI